MDYKTKVMEKSEQEAIKRIDQLIALMGMVKDEASLEDIVYLLDTVYGKGICEDESS